MDHKLITLAVAGTAAGALALGAAAPAASAGGPVTSTATITYAAPPTGTAVFRDAHRDVAHGVDIWKVRLTNRKLVRVDITHADLVRSWRSGSSASVFLDTDPARRGPEFVLAGGLYAGADYQLTRAEGWHAVGAPLQGSYRLRLDYARDRTHIRIGRAVLGKPGKVRVAVRVGGERPDGATVRDWLVAPRWFTPWVSRG